MYWEWALCSGPHLRWERAVSMPCLVFAMLTSFVLMCQTHGYCILVVAGLGVWPWRPADPTMVLPILISLVFMCHTSFVLMCHTWIMHHHGGRPLRLTLEASRPHHGGSHVDIIGFDVSHMDRQSLEVGTSLGPAWDQPKILVRIRKQLICLILTRPGPAWDQPGTSLKYRLG